MADYNYTLINSTESMTKPHRRSVISMLVVAIIFSFFAIISSQLQIYVPLDKNGPMMKDDYPDIKTKEESRIEKIDDILDNKYKNHMKSGDKHVHDVKKVNIQSKSELVRLENDHALESSETLLTHLYVHIPKTGGSSAFGLLLRLMGQGIFKNDATTKTPWKYRPCQQGTQTLTTFPSGFFTEFRKTPCNLWMTEDSIENSVKHSHAYTIIRLPEHHVVSQYFHCKEAERHKKKEKMPALDEWLDHHVNRMESKNITKANFSLPKPDKYNCYDPINLQSYMTDFDQHLSVSDLQSKFEVIGIMDQFEKSVCVISIRYTGFVTPQCDCTDQQRHRSLIRTDHGVQHHGATFNLTDDQHFKIAKLTQLDSLLYGRAALAFNNQVEEIEEEFNIVLCQTPQLN
mmetsp:Transcript_1150/g.1168  ORF Transcript_1150/g.1168 Transcript_1150/m.1168 type:complete len:401 (+) Transcript_1150:103-1305(+)